MRRAAILALLALALPGIAAAAPAKPAAKPGAAPAAASAASPRKFGDFYVRCVTTKSVAPCDLYQERADKDGGRRVVGFSIGYVPSASRYIIQVAVPLGIDIEKGVIITDGKNSTAPMPYRRCDPSGCFVEGSADKSLLDLFSKMGRDAKVRVFAYNGAGDGKAVNINFSFDGFSEGLGDMIAENRTRASAPDAATDAR